MRFCLECGTPLADAPIIVNWQDSGTQKQSNADTASFNQTRETQVRGGWNYQQQQGFTTPPSPQRPGSSKKVFFIVGGIFLLFLLLIGAGAAIVGYNLIVTPKPSPSPVPSPSVSPSPTISPSPTRSPKPSPSVTPSVSPTPDDTPAPSNNSSASTKFDRMWVDYNVTEKGRRGMRIHTKFWVYNLKNQNLYLAIYFQKKDGSKLYTNNRNFRSKDGQVAVYRSLKPAYDETIYEDLTLFMPYDELNLASGTYELQMDADVIYENGDMVEHLNFYDFEYEKD
jgi:hypothetical protein